MAVACVPDILAVACVPHDVIYRARPTVTVACVPHDVIYRARPTVTVACVYNAIDTNFYREAYFVKHCTVLNMGRNISISPAQVSPFRKN